MFGSTWPCFGGTSGWNDESFASCQRAAWSMAKVQVWQAPAEEATGAKVEADASTAEDTSAEGIDGEDASTAEDFEGCPDCGGWRPPGSMGSICSICRGPSTFFHGFESLPAFKMFLFEHLLKQIKCIGWHWQMDAGNHYEHDVKNNLYDLINCAFTCSGSCPAGVEPNSGFIVVHWSSWCCSGCNSSRWWCSSSSWCSGWCNSGSGAIGNLQWVGALRQHLEPWHDLIHSWKLSLCFAWLVNCVFEQHFSDRRLALIGIESLGLKNWLRREILDDSGISLKAQAFFFEVAPRAHLRCARLMPLDCMIAFWPIQSIKWWLLFVWLIVCLSLSCSIQSMSVPQPVTWSFCNSGTNWFTIRGSIVEAPVSRPGSPGQTFGWWQDSASWLCQSLSKCDCHQSADHSFIQVDSCASWIVSWTSSMCVPCVPSQAMNWRFFQMGLMKRKLIPEWQWWLWQQWHSEWDRAIHDLCSMAALAFQSIINSLFNFSKEPVADRQWQEQKMA